LATVDLLEREVRRIGLTLNDSKTVIRRGDTYEASLKRRKDAPPAAEECSGVERHQARRELSRLSQPSTPRLGLASLAGEAWAARRAVKPSPLWLWSVAKQGRSGGQPSSMNSAARGVDRGRGGLPNAPLAAWEGVGCVGSATRVGRWRMLVDSRWR